MIAFLTSSPFTPGACAFNPANGFVEELRGCLPNPARVLFVASYPEDAAHMDQFAGDVRVAMEGCGIQVASLSVLDDRTRGAAESLVHEADCIVLAGGHVPTQNRFFTEINLREKLHGYGGVVIGISAGSMNSAEIVYVQPEEAGEALDPGFVRFTPGLGLTRTQLLPHYQMVKDNILDGMRLFEDITFGDSMGHCFTVLVDGSYLLLREGREELRGEAYQIRDGVMEKICGEGESVEIP